MTFYRAFYQQYEDVMDLGLFSTEERAREALDFYYNSEAKKYGHCYYDRRDGEVSTLVVDDYYIKNMSPLAKAMNE